MHSDGVRKIDTNIDARISERPMMNMNSPNQLPRMHCLTPHLTYISHRSTLRTLRSMFRIAKSLMKTGVRLTVVDDVETGRRDMESGTYMHSNSCSKAPTSLAGLVGQFTCAILHYSTYKFARFGGVCTAIFSAKERSTTLSEHASGQAGSILPKRG